jgi:hypothetical protein
MYTSVSHGTSYFHIWSSLPLTNFMKQSPSWEGDCHLAVHETWRFVNCIHHSLPFDRVLYQMTPVHISHPTYILWDFRFSWRRVWRQQTAFWDIALCSLIEVDWWYWLLLTAWYCTKRPIQLWPFYDLLCSPWVLIIPNSSTKNSLLWLQQTHLVAKHGETGW